MAETLELYNLAACAYDYTSWHWTWRHCNNERDVIATVNVTSLQQWTWRHRWFTVSTNRESVWLKLALSDITFRYRRLYTCCMRNCTGLTSHNVFTTNWESQCIAVSSTRPPSTWSTAVHQSQTFSADVIYGQPVDITWPYHVTGSALLVLGPSLSLVQQSGTRYQTVSLTRCSPPTASDNHWKRTYFVATTQHTQRSRDASWLCVI